MAIPTREESVQSDKLACQIEDKIEALLVGATEENYYNICKLLDEEESVDISTKNQRIYILEMLGTILRAELQKGINPHIFVKRSIDDLISLYKKTVLLLRRIEFDFPLEYQMEIYEFIVEEQISLLAIVGIIQSSKILIDKDKIRNGLVELLQYGANNE